MPEILVLSCPVCAAPLKPGSEQCTYCGSYIFIKVDLPKLDRHSLNQVVIQEHIDDFRKRIKQSRDDEEAFYGLGLAYFNLGLVDESVEELKKAAKLTPENPYIQTQLAIALHEQVKDGNTRAAKERDARLERALALDPDNTEAISLKAKVMIERGDFYGALDLLKRVSGDEQRSLALAINGLVEHGTAALDRRDWKRARHAWEHLEAFNNHQAARGLKLRFLSMNSQLIPDSSAIMRGLRMGGMIDNAVKGGASKLKRLGMTILVFYGVIMVWGIVLAIPAELFFPSDVEGQTSDGATVLYLVFSLPCFAAIFYFCRRTWRKYTPKQPNSVPASLTQADILAGRIDDSTLNFATKAVLSKL